MPAPAGFAWTAIVPAVTVPSVPAETAAAYVNKLGLSGPAITPAEISEAEAIPLGTAKTRIRAGLTRLRETMTSEGNHR